jgi:hypothetical protein
MTDAHAQRVKIPVLCRRLNFKHEQGLLRNPR